VPSSAKKQLEWAARAARDLLAIDAYIANKNPVAAETVVDFILAQAEFLRQHPLLGKIMKPGGPRELVLTSYPYNIIYRITRSKIRIVRIIHQSRQFP
jgi:toxin ParE1/3/4